MYFNTFPNLYVPWLVSRAIQSSNIISLAYLLVRTQNQEEEAIDVLKTSYKELGGAALDFNLRDYWEDLFRDEVPEYSLGQFQRVDER